jgi:hypothetical protein
MAEKKSKTKAGKGKAAKKKEAEVRCEAEHEHDESCCAEPDFLSGNSQRSFALYDLWFETLSQAVDEQIAPEQNKREMMFLTVSNAVLDMVMDILPEDMSAVVAENIDDYLAVTLVNKKYGVDILKTFQDEFTKAHGRSFDDEEKLKKALDDFQEKYWNTPRKDLKDKSPNQAVEEALAEFDL